MEPIRAHPETIENDNGCPRQRPQKLPLWVLRFAAYEPYVGRWSRLVALEFLRWLAIREGARWVDVGCGTGGGSRGILRQADPSEVVWIDPSAAYVKYAQAHIVDPRARFEIGSASALPLD